MLHHLGALPDGLGSAPSSTRWVDWLDLLTPYVVVGFALLALATAGTDRRGWWLALLGGGAYVQGHAVHLAANSIGNVRGDAPPVHLWDEVVGHWLWYAGFALLVVALGRALVLRGDRGAPAARLRHEPRAARRLRRVARRLPGAERAAVSTARLLAVSAVAMVATHWLRLLPLGYAAPGATRYEDFVDLLTPYVVAGPALLALARTGASHRSWVLALLGAAVFTQGQGLHLSANSISFATGPAQPAYLWDETVGHHLWFVGLALLVVVVTSAVTGSGLAVTPAGLALAGLVGLTWAANVIEGGAVPLGVLLAAALLVHGWRLRSEATARLLLVAYGISLLLVAGYGVWQGGFPQPSELGWL